MTPIKQRDEENKEVALDGESNQLLVEMKKMMLEIKESVSKGEIGSIL